MSSPHRPRDLRLLAALATVYLVWGSTYLGIAIAIRTIPPFTMGALRFAAGGGLLLGWELVSGGLRRERPTRRQVRDAAVVGVLLLGIGNGFVAFGEQTVASGIAAVLVAMVPVWLAVLGWVYLRERLPRTVVAGIALGLGGVVVLVWPEPGARLEVLGIGVLILAPLGWAHGSLFSARRADLPRRPLTTTGIQMLAGATTLAIEGILTGEAGRLDPAGVSAASIGAVVYLTLVGSILAFNAYAWLLRNAPLSLAGTYAYVNPVVAVALGAIFLAEPISTRTLVASGVIVVAVAMIVTARSRAGASRGGVAVDPEEAIRLDLPAEPEAVPAGSRARSVPDSAARSAPQPTQVPISEPGPRPRPSG
jgi:drug/metabolite transporter (DMT)-like permease